MLHWPPTLSSLSYSSQPDELVRLYTVSVQSAGQLTYFALATGKTKSTPDDERYARLAIIKRHGRIQAGAACVLDVTRLFSICLMTLNEFIMNIIILLSNSKLLLINNETKIEKH